MYYPLTSCLIFLFLFSLFYHLPCASSKQELEWCEPLFQCGDISAGFPFWGGNRPESCGHASLELHCDIKNITSLNISNLRYNVLQINQTSNTLKLVRADLLGSFCSATFNSTILPLEISEVLPIYKSLTIFYLCNPRLQYLSSYTCPGSGRGLVSAYQSPNYHSSCQGSFTVKVPTSFFPEVEKLNLDFLESVLRKGFEVKVKNDEILCEECSSSPALYRRCAQPFSCGDQGGLLFPFWIHGREDCGHPDFKLHCSSRLAELNVSSGTFRILDANYDSRIVRLARSDFKDIMCPTKPLHVPFDKSVVLPFAPDTMMLTIYYHCADLSSSIDGTSANVGSLVCGNYDEDSNNYYEMRNITDVNSGRVSTNLKESCNSYVSIPVPGSALYTLRPENLTKTLEQGFELELNQDCSVCLESKGACGYNETSRSFVCYCNDGTFSNNYSSKKKSHGTLVKAIPIVGSSVAGVVLFLVFLTSLPCLLRKRETRLRQQKLKALIPLEHYTYTQVKRITKSFVEVVGTGGFGIVYRGTLSDGRMVAVKVLKDSKGNGEDFINEVASMSRTSHLNIVSLLGFCSEGSKRAIIYEFLGNGSLDKFISSKNSVNMDWEALYRIALGVAHGLEYLHHGCKTRIVHFDIKPQNVLLDDNFCPKVSDFGLAKLCEKKESCGLLV